MILHHILYDNTTAIILHSITTYMTNHYQVIDIRIRHTKCSFIKYMTMIQPVLFLAPEGNGLIARQAYSHSASGARHLPFQPLGDKKCTEESRSDSEGTFANGEPAGRASVCALLILIFAINARNVRNSHQNHNHLEGLSPQTCKMVCASLSLYQCIV